MELEDIMTRLRSNEADLRAKGVTHAAVFGSRARGDHEPDSDTDILIEMDPAMSIDVFEYAGLKTYIAELFAGPVDVVTLDLLKPLVRPGVTADAVYAF